MNVNEGRPIVKLSNCFAVQQVEVYCKLGTDG